MSLNATTKDTVIETQRHISRDRERQTGLSKSSAVVSRISQDECLISGNSGLFLSRLRVPSYPLGPGLLAGRAPAQQEGSGLVPVLSSLSFLPRWPRQVGHVFVLPAAFVCFSFHYSSPEDIFPSGF